MINAICQLPATLVCGIAALAGALSYAGYTIYKNKKADPNFKVEWTRIADTTWQAIVTGVAAANTMTCGYYTIFIAFVAAIGMDKIANKFQINSKSVINLITIAAEYLQKRDK